MAFAFVTMRSYGIQPAPDGVDSALAAFGKRRSPGSREYVAVDGGRPVGSIMLRQESEAAAELAGFYVRPGHRGRGIGRALVRVVLAAARELGYRRIHLTTDEPLKAAMHLFESFDWTRQPDRPTNGADYLYSLDL